MEDRPYEMAAFDAGQDEFLGVSTMGTNTYRIMVMKWNGQKFESFQNITASGVSDIPFQTIILYLLKIRLKFDWFIVTKKNASV